MSSKSRGAVVPHILFKWYKDPVLIKEHGGKTVKKKVDKIVIDDTGKEKKVFKYLGSFIKDKRQKGAFGKKKFKYLGV